MSSPLPTAPKSRRREWLDKYDLTIAPEVAQTPENRRLIESLAAGWRERITNGAEAHTLIRETIKISADKQVGDGRHRLEAALLVPEITQIECEYLDGADFVTLVAEMLVERRHYTKSGLAYALRHTAIQSAAAGAEGRASMGGHAKHGSAKPIESAKQKIITLKALAASADVSVDLLQQAAKLEQFYMPKADQLITDWTALHQDEAERFLAWQDARPYSSMPWTMWRMERLAEMGIADDAASVNVIPRHWREVEEDKIFNGVHDPEGEECDRLSYSLGSCLKAMGSYFATAGKPRADLKPEAPLLHLTIENKVKSFFSTAFANWGEIDMPGRLVVIQRMQSLVIEAPEDVRQGLLVALTKKGGAQ